MQLFYIYMLFTIHRNFIDLIIIILFIINITCKKSIFDCSTDFQKLNLPFCFNLDFKLSLYSALQRPNATKRFRTALCYVITFGEIYLFYVYVYLYFVKPCLLLWIRICHHNEIYALVHVSTLFLKLLKNHRVWYPCQTLLFGGRQLNLNFSFASVFPLSCYNYDREWGPAKIAMWNSFCKINPRHMARELKVAREKVNFLKTPQICHLCSLGQR